MEKSKFLPILKIVVRYILPILIGWLEGDTHTVQDAVVSMF